MTNNRQHERLEIALPVVIVHEGREIAAQSKNLSSGGMLVEASADVPFGASVRLVATLPPNSHPVDVVATVRWIRDGAIGLQFGSLRAKDAWAINQLVKLLAEAKPA